ncbi:MAG: hypothetical protein C4297_07135 [Gemmataceae bacterium]
MKPRVPLVRRSVRHFLVTDLLVVLATGTAVAALVGSLLLGDSVQESLRRAVLRRLGPVDYVVRAPLFFRTQPGDDLAFDLRNDAESESLIEGVAPLIALRASVIAGDGRQYAADVHVLGVDERFWQLMGQAPADLTAGVALNQTLARELHVDLGDQVELRLERPSVSPAGFAFSASTLTHMTLESSPVTSIVASGAAADFSLEPGILPPRTVYVALSRLQRRLQQAHLHTQGMANTLLIVGRGRPDRERLQAWLRRHVTATDLGLRVRPGPAYVALESRRLLLDPALVHQVQDWAAAHRWRVLPVSVYLANVLWSELHFPAGLTAGVGSAGGSSAALIPVAGAAALWGWGVRPAYAYVPYATIAAGVWPGEPPWYGRLVTPDGKPWTRPLAPDEVLVSHWLAQDLCPWGMCLPASLHVRFFVEGDGRLLREAETTLRVVGVVRQEGLGAEPVLVPDFPGISGRTIRDWEPPFPREQWHPEWIRPRDEEYWQRWRAAPKLFVSIETALRHWPSRYGVWTSLLLAPAVPDQSGPSASSEQWARTVSSSLGASLDPSSFGLRIEPVREQALASVYSGAAQLFGALFASFSSFLIGTCLLLTGLLFRLHLERRGWEIGLLKALGWPDSRLARVYLAEGVYLVAAGLALGLGLAVAYTEALIYGVRTLWQDTLPLVFLDFYLARSTAWGGPIPYPSLLVGGGAAGLGAFLAIGAGLRRVVRNSPRSLLASRGDTAATGSAESVPAHSLTPCRRCCVLGLVLATAGLGLAVYGAQADATARPAYFLAGGACVLVAGSSLAYAVLVGGGGPRLSSRGRAGCFVLGLQAARRRPGRSITILVLLASATFLLVSLECFRPTARHDAPAPGGFDFWVETTVPIPYVPDGPHAWEQLADEPVPSLAAVHTIGLTVRPGDDISCLNLNRPQEPRLVGVPAAHAGELAVDFAALYRPDSQEEKQPWRILQRPVARHDHAVEVPVFLDENTATWVLRKHLGDLVPITDDSGRPVYLRISGLLRHSIFQSEVLVDAETFRRLFPTRAGYRILLVRSGSAAPAVIEEALRTHLGARFGAQVQTTRARLASFLAVESMYISTFQVLGSLGLLVGTLGLGIVLVRNMLERVGELALLQALGYADVHRRWILWGENSLLVVGGLLTGLTASATAVVPHLLVTGRALPWQSLAWLVAAEAGTAWVAGALAVHYLHRLPALTVLRRE